MNEVCTLREKQPASLAASPGPQPVAMVERRSQPQPASYPFELPERRSTLRALIDEFRRGEYQHRDVTGSGATSWAGEATVRGQLLKGPSPQQQQQQHRRRGDGGMRKSASVWYAVPPAPDRPLLVSRMSMPNLKPPDPRARDHHRDDATERIPEER